MEKFILNPTDTAQWQALVDEARRQLNMELDEQLESYLVFLLMRFATEPQMASSILGLEYLQSYHQQGQQRDDTLRDVGDKCLLFSGLFPGQAKRRRVKVSYFVEIGQSAYGVLSDRSNESLSSLFAELCQQFIPLMEVLQNMRDVGEQASLQPLDAAELYLDTGSKRALDDLRKVSDSLIVDLTDKNDKSH